MKVKYKSSGKQTTAQYITTSTGNKRMSVDGKVYTDKSFSETFEKVTSYLKWSSHVKCLFEEIIENGGPSMRIMDKPLRITYTILQEAATRAMELQDDKLISIFCRLALYEEADPHSEKYDKEAVEKIVSKFN